MFWSLNHKFKIKYTIYMTLCVYFKGVCVCINHYPGIISLLFTKREVGSLTCIVFRACVESILLYGSETWTMKKTLQDRFDGTFTRILMRVQNISWREHKTKAEIYGDIPPISSIVACRRTCFAGHCFHAKDQIISDVISLRLPCLTQTKKTDELH